MAAEAVVEKEVAVVVMMMAEEVNFRFVYFSMFCFMSSVN